MSNSSDLLENALKQLGLTDFEANLYQLLIKSTDLNVAKLSEKLGVYRLKVYDGLNKLELLGLLKKDADFSRQIYLEPPSKIITQLKRKQNDLASLSQNLETYLPQLQNEYYSTRKNPIVKVYEGKTQFLSLFHQILEEMDQKDEFYALGEGQDIYGIVPFEYYYENFALPRIAKQISAKVLWKQPVISEVRELISKDKQEYRQSKILPKSFNAPGEVWITPNFIVNWTTVVPKAVVINDKTLVEFYKQTFETLWSSL